MYRKILVLMFAAAAFALPSLAQNGKLNGTWKLNTSKSDFGQMPPPASETDVITISGTSFKQQVASETARGKSAYTRACTIDGKDTPLTPDNPNAHIGPVVLSKIQCGWEGGSLVITEGFQMQGADGTDKLTYSVSGDGNTLTLTSQISGPMSMNRKMVYDRAENGGAANDPAAAASAASSGPTPDFSGTWKLNPSKSDFGQGQPPTSQVTTIEIHGIAMKVTNDVKGGFMGDMTMVDSFTTDGKASTWDGMGGAKVNGTAHWEGSTLVVDAKTDFQGTDVTIKDTYKLSDDGKTLYINTHAGTSMGDFDSKMGFDKQ